MVGAKDKMIGAALLGALAVPVAADDAAADQVQVIIQGGEGAEGGEGRRERPRRHNGKVWY